MGVVFDLAHAMKTVLLNCRIFLMQREYLFYLLVTLLSLHNIIKLHYETF